LKVRGRKGLAIDSNFFLIQAGRKILRIWRYQVPSKMVADLDQAAIGSEVHLEVPRSAIATQWLTPPDEAEGGKIALEQDLVAYRLNSIIVAGRVLMSNMPDHAMVQSQGKIFAFSLEGVDDELKAVLGRVGARVAVAIPHRNLLAQWDVEEDGPRDERVISMHGRQPN